VSGHSRVPPLRCPQENGLFGKQAMNELSAGTVTLAVAIAAVPAEDQMFTVRRVRDTDSPVRFAKHDVPSCAISSNFAEIVARLLCDPDCMAEGEGFEPPVRFPAQWFSRPPVSTAHASLRVETLAARLNLVYNTTVTCFLPAPLVIISTLAMLSGERRVRSKAPFDAGPSLPASQIPTR
jgi:hypothetical protein